MRTIFLFLTLFSWGQAAVPIDHVIILFMENRSFDHLFGTYPGAEGLANYKGKQCDKEGVVYQTLPQPIFEGKLDPRFPADLPNAPFLLSKFVGPFDRTASPVHRFYHMQRQYGAGGDGIPMGKWTTESRVGGLAMGYYDRTTVPTQWRLADEFVLLDHYFQGVHGGSFANHFDLIAGTVAKWTTAPDAIRAHDGKDGEVTPDGYVVNNLESGYAPHVPCNPPRCALALAEPQTMPTIGDRLDEAHIPWAYYAGGWAGGLNAYYHGCIAHYTPFQYMKNIMETTEGRAHLRDSDELVLDLREGRLPTVSWVKPPFYENGHAGTGSLGDGDRWIGHMVREIMSSRYWPKVAIIITYDEGGGWFDHLRPPEVDRFGYGTRVPTIIVSPYAKKGFIGHGIYSHTSILKFIEWRFGLAPLTDRDRKVETFLEAFDFTQAPRPPVKLD